MTMWKVVGEIRVISINNQLCVFRDGFRRVDMLNYKIQIASERRFTLHAYFSAFYLHLPSSNGKRAIDAEI